MHFLTCFQQDRSIIDPMPAEYDTSNPSTLMPGGSETDSQVQPGSKNGILFQRVKKKGHAAFLVTFPPPWRLSILILSDEEVKKKNVGIKCNLAVQT